MFGHSTGGRAAIQVAVAKIAEKYSIGAVVALNPDPKQDSAGNITGCPILVLSGTGDKVEPKGSALADFEAARTPRKAFCQFVGTTHLEPLFKSTRYGPYTAAYLTVYLKLVSDPGFS